MKDGQRLSLRVAPGVQAERCCARPCSSAMALADPVATLSSTSSIPVAEGFRDCVRSQLGWWMTAVSFST